MASPVQERFEGVAVAGCSGPRTGSALGRREEYSVPSTSSCEEQALHGCALTAVDGEAGDKTGVDASCRLRCRRRIQRTCAPSCGQMKDPRHCPWWIAPGDQRFAAGGRTLALHKVCGQARTRSCQRIPGRLSPPFGPPLQRHWT